MNKEDYEKQKKEYLDIMKDMTLEEKIQYLKDCEFMISMIDTWDSDDRLAHQVVIDLLKELGEKNE